MFGKLKKDISLNLQSAFGQKVGQKIVVFESDDWGGVRMPSVAAFERLCAAGLPIQHDHFNKYDTNASVEDITALFDILKKHRDSHGQHPVFTFNVTTGNPDFERIRENQFSTFFWEPFNATMERVCPGALQVWREGITAGVMYPQYHGREHVHQVRWLESLRHKDPQTTTAFNNGVFGVVSQHDSAEYFMAAYDYPDNVAEEMVRTSIEEGLEVFQKVFGFVSKSFIPPCYIASHTLLSHLKNKGVVALQGKIIHLLPQGIVNGKRTYQRTLRKSGFHPKNGRVDLVRNCFFEPSSKLGTDWVSNCLQRMEIAFRWGKPVVIDTHRVNYIGSLVPGNRDENLKLLDQLLHRMLEKWGDITFMHSAQLTDFYMKNNG